MSTEDIKATSRHVFEEVLNKGNMGVVDELFSSDFVLHTPTGPVHGREGYKQFINMYRSAFPDIQFTIDELIAEGDKVAVHYTSQGTHLGDLQGIPPTGKQGIVIGVVTGRFANGKLVEGWLIFDALGMMQQIGVFPSLGQAGS